MYKKQYYINPLTASEEEKDDFDWYIFESCRMNISTSLHLMMNFYLELAKSGHIDNSYYKYQLLKINFALRIILNIFDEYLCEGNNYFCFLELLFICKICVNLINIGIYYTLRYRAVDESVF